MRLPSSFGKGARSSPSASRPSFTHCTIRMDASVLEGSSREGLHLTQPVAPLGTRLRSCLRMAEQREPLNAEAYAQSWRKKVAAGSSWLLWVGILSVINIAMLVAEYEVSFGI